MRDEVIFAGISRLRAKRAAPPRKGTIIDSVTDLTSGARDSRITRNGAIKIEVVMSG